MKLTKKEKIIFNIVAIISIAIIAFAVSPKTMQNDTYYTVKIGEYILDNGIDMMDPFSWHEGLKYTYPHWLYDVMMYKIYSIGNWDGIYISTIVFAIILGITMYLTNLKISKNRLISFVLTAISIYLLRDFIAARDQLVTFILFAVTVFSLERFVDSGKKIYEGILIILSLLIANLHCAVWPFFFVLFLPYLVEYFGIKILDLDTFIRLKSLFRILKIKVGKSDNKENKILEEKNNCRELSKKIKERIKEDRKNSYKIIIEENKNIKRLLIVFVICAFMGLLTPLKDTPYTYLYKTMKGTTTQNINEHLPITLWENKPMLVTFGLVIALFMFSKEKIKLRDLFMLGGLIILTIMSKRQSSMLLVVGLLYFSKYLSHFISEIKINKFFKSFEKVVGSIIGAILVIAIFGLLGYNLYKGKIRNEYVSENSYPIKACDYILENIDLNNARFYNEYNYGSYMLYRGIPVFIDSRADLYDSKFNKDTNVFNDFMDISNMNTDYEEKFKEYGITHVIMYENSKLNAVLKLDSNYKELYSDNNFIVYERLTK